MTTGSQLVWDVLSVPSRKGGQGVSNPTSDSHTKDSTGFFLSWAASLSVENVKGSSLRLWQNRTLEVTSRLVGLCYP